MAHASSLVVTTCTCRSTAFLRTLCRSSLSRLEFALNDRRKETLPCDISESTASAPAGSRSETVTMPTPILSNSPARSANSSGPCCSSRSSTPRSPLVGIFLPVAAMARARAAGNVSPKHATSPVDLISTPSLGSAPSI